MRKGGAGKVMLWSALAAVAVAVAVVVLAGRRAPSPSHPRPGEIAPEGGSGPRGTARPAGAAPTGPESPRASQPREDGTSSSDDDSEDAVRTEQEKLAAATELLVEEFDSLVDAWREQSSDKGKPKSVSLGDIDKFAAAFRKIPKNRRDECIHRALNLIPDENVMLLVGVLMDKSMDKDIVETVYNDILNRDEDVKKPILQEIFKDKTHPCWADTAWILDVTGELPKAK